MRNTIIAGILLVLVCTNVANAQREERKRQQRKESLRETSTYKVVEAEATAQDYTVEGILTDANTGDPLIGVTIQI